jgi:hypothetical protein
MKVVLNRHQIGVIGGGLALVEQASRERKIGPPRLQTVRHVVQTMTDGMLASEFRTQYQFEFVSTDDIMAVIGMLGSLEYVLRTSPELLPLHPTKCEASRAEFEDLRDVLFYAFAAQLPTAACA